MMGVGENKKVEFILVKITSVVQCFMCIDTQLNCTGEYWHTKEDDYNKNIDNNNKTIF